MRGSSIHRVCRHFRLARWHETSNVVHFNHASEEYKPVEQGHNCPHKVESFFAKTKSIEQTTPDIMGQGVEIETDPVTGIKYILDTNPADGTLLQKVPCATFDEIESKIRSLKQQQTKWRLVPLEERVETIRNVLTAVFGVKDESTNKQLLLTALISQEMGKTLPEAQEEVKAIAALAGDMLTLVQEANQPQTIGNAIIVRDPLGIVAILSPWNYPAGEIMLHLLPALVAGNAVIVKPSEVTPLTGEFLISTLQQQLTSNHKLPIDIVQGDAQVGEILVQHKDINAVSMTGSSAVGKQIMGQCGRHLKRVILEVFMSFKHVLFCIRAVFICGPSNPCTHLSYLFCSPHVTRLQYYLLPAAWR